MEARDLDDVVPRLDADQLIATVHVGGVGAHAHTEQAFAVAAQQRDQRPRHGLAVLADGAVDPHAVFALVVHVEPRRLTATHRDRLEPHVAHQVERDVVGALVEARLEHHVLPRRQPVDVVVAVLVRRAAPHRTGLQAKRDHQRVGERAHPEAGDGALHRAAGVDDDLDRRRI